MVPQKLDGQIPDNESPIFITGGNETTYDAKRLLSHAPFDVAVIGYGEKVLEDLIRAILCSKERKLSSILKDIDGVAYINEKGHFVFSRPGPYKH